MRVEGSVISARERADLDHEKLMDRLRIFAKRRQTECGLTQGALARRAGFSPATLSTWLKRESELEPENVVKLCGALHDLRPHAATASVLAEAEALAATA